MKTVKRKLKVDIWKNGCGADIGYRRHYIHFTGIKPQTDTECIICKNGTIGWENEQLVCRGECGTIYSKNTEFIYVTLKVDGKKYFMLPLYPITRRSKDQLRAAVNMALKEHNKGTGKRVVL